MANKQVHRTYWKQCNGWMIKHISFDDRWFVMHPMTDDIVGIGTSLNKARKIARENQNEYSN